MKLLGETCSLIWPLIASISKNSSQTRPIFFITLYPRQTVVDSYPILKKSIFDSFIHVLDEINGFPC